MRTHSSCRTAGAQSALVGAKSILISAFATLFCCVSGLKIVATAESAHAQKNHMVAARFESGPRGGELTLLFTINPTTRIEPVVHWLRTATKATTLAVRSDSAGKYSVVLADLQGEPNGQVLIELSDPKSGLHELHSVDFAQREVLASRPSSAPSRDGHFVVFTRPVGISQAQRLVIGSSEQPMSPLPPGVSAGEVEGVYSLEFLPPMERVDGWQLTMTTPSNDAKPALFYLPKPGTGWKALQVKPVEEHFLVTAKLAGPGTYLVVRQVKR